jgi:D-lactate dehydrogenase
VTFKTVEEYPLKATALVFFPSLRDACQVTLQLTDCQVTAAEIMDRNALRSVQDRPGMPDELHRLDPGTAALLIDTSAHTKEAETQVSRIRGILSSQDRLSSGFTMRTV